MRKIETVHFDREDYSVGLAVARVLSSTGLLLGWGRTNWHSGLYLTVTTKRHVDLALLGLGLAALG